MKIATHPFHRAVEFYLLNLFPEHEFQFVSNKGLPSAPESMPMRPHPKNYRLVDHFEDCDFAIAHSKPGYLYFRNKIRTIMKFDNMPFFKSQWYGINDIKVAVHYTHEASSYWGFGEQRFVCYHPIESFGVNVGDDRRFLNMATMPINWFGQMKGAGLLRYLIVNGIPIKLVGMNNEKDYPMCDPEFVTSEERMKEILCSHIAYACTSPQFERSPLEAMSTGMPVIMIRHPFNTLLNELGDLIIFAETPADYVEICRDILLNGHGKDKDKIRERVAKIFTPSIVRAQWQKAFDAILTY